MDRADRYLRRLETLFEGLAGLALFLMMASISIDAIGAERSWQEIWTESDRARRDGCPWDASI